MVDAVKSAGGSAEAVACDIADSAKLAESIEKIADAHGRIDVLLVNNAGITKGRKLFLADG